MSKYSLKKIFINEKRELDTKGFGKHGEKFPQSPTKNNPLKGASEEEIDAAVGALGEELNTKGFGKHGEQFPKTDDKNNPLKGASEEEIDAAVGALGEGEEFDAAFKKHTDTKELDDPFAESLEECGCGDASTDGLSADVLSQGRKEELYANDMDTSDIVVLTIGAKDDGINFKAPGLNETYTDEDDFDDHMEDDEDYIGQDDYDSDFVPGAAAFGHSGEHSEYFDNAREAGLSGDMTLDDLIDSGFTPDEIMGFLQGKLEKPRG